MVDDVVVGVVGEVDEDLEGELGEFGVVAVGG